MNLRLYSWVFILSLISVPLLYADDNTCFLEAPQQDDVWVVVHDVDGDGNRGKIVWEGKIEAGLEVKISTSDGHIRYRYKRDKDQPYEGGTTIECYGDRRKLVD